MLLTYAIFCFYCFYYVQELNEDDDDDDDDDDVQKSCFCNPQIFSFGPGIQPGVISD